MIVIEGVVVVGHSDDSKDRGGRTCWRERRCWKGQCDRGFWLQSMGKVELSLGRIGVVGVAGVDQLSRRLEDRGMNEEEAFRELGEMRREGKEGTGVSRCKLIGGS